MILLCAVASVLGGVVKWEVKEKRNDCSGLGSDL